MQWRDSVCVIHTANVYVGLWSLTGVRATYDDVSNQNRRKTARSMHEMCGAIALYTGLVRHA